MFKTEDVPDLVHHRGEQVDVSGRGRGRVGAQLVRRQDMRELGIVERARIDEPAAAGCIVVQQNAARHDNPSREPPRSVMPNSR